MSIGKQRSFLKSHHWALAIAGLMWLGMNPLFAAGELDVPAQGPAALRGLLPESEPGSLNSEALATEQIPMALQDMLAIEASATNSTTAVESPTLVNVASSKNETSASPATTVPVPFSSHNNQDIEPAPRNQKLVLSANGSSARRGTTDSSSNTAGSQTSAGNEASMNNATTTTGQGADESVPATNVNQEIMARPDFVDPKVERNDIHVASIDNENFEFGLFVGMFSTEDFGTNPVYGLKLAYHVNEAVFFEVATGISKTQRTSAEEILNVDFISETDRELTYYNFSFGYNALPSETYFGEGWAFHSAIYVIGGAGFTEFAGDSFFTLNFGVGYRFLVTDWLALHLDVRDHLFEMDLLGEKKTTQNIELSTGVNFFF